GSSRSTATPSAPPAARTPTSSSSPNTTSSACPTRARPRPPDSVLRDRARHGAVDRANCENGGVSNGTDDRRETDSGIEIKPVYTDADLEGWNADAQLGMPGQPPYTRGVYPRMYRGRPWTMRQYAGFGSAEETNQRFKFLLQAGQTGLSCAFDLPTQMGYDSDHPR